MSRVVHFEIHASDPAKLSAFYAKVFDWKVSHIPQLDYYMFDTGSGDGINGGMPKRMGPPPPEGAAVNAFVCSVGVTSVDDSLKRALEAGATVALPKMAMRRLSGLHQGSRRQHRRHSPGRSVRTLIFSMEHWLCSASPMLRPASRSR